MSPASRTCFHPKLPTPSTTLFWILCNLQARSGASKGTKLGPWLFLLMINDLSVSKIFSMWKYVDDTTVSETVPIGQQSKARKAVDQKHDWSKDNLFQLNCDKTKELTICFNPQRPPFPRSCISGVPREFSSTTRQVTRTYDQLQFNLERSHRRTCYEIVSKTLFSCSAYTGTCSIQRSCFLLLCMY